MPFVSSTIKLPRELDRRVHLSEDDKERIKSLYKDGFAVRAIGREFADKCDRRVIQYVLFPDRYTKMLQNAKRRRLEKGNTLKEYGRKNWRETIREHRQYKQSLYLKGLIKTN